MKCKMQQIVQCILGDLMEDIIFNMEWIYQYFQHMCHSVEAAALTAINVNHIAVNWQYISCIISVFSWVSVNIVI